MTDHQRFIGLLLGGAAMVVLLMLLALNAGPVAIDLVDAAQAYWGGESSIPALVFGEVRLPRTLLAATVGASLGMGGACLQGLLRNPLASPGLVGVSNGAAFGAVLALYFGLSSLHVLAVPITGIIGASIAAGLIFLLAGKQSSITTLILAGVAINAVAGSMISLALNFAPNPYAMSEMVFWLLGSVSNKTLADVQLALPLMLIGWALMLARSGFLEALSLGEDTAQSLGFSVTRERWLIVTGVTLAVGAAVSVSGNIGFVGLVVPHLLRPLVQHSPAKLVALSGLGGAALVLLADISVQYLSPHQELKLGVITALVGGPFFLYLIIKTRNTLP